MGAPGAERSLLFAYAHPDDEAFISGGTIRLEVERGARVTLAVATGGEEGQIVNPELEGSVRLSDLPAIRLQELACSRAALGISRVLHLGYCDSGMEGSESSRRPEAFANADLDTVTEALVRIMRELRPQVVVTFDEQGGYGHPDHIKISHATRLAYERSGDPTWYPDTGAAWQPLKLYYAVVARDMIRRARAGFASRGLQFNFGTGLPNVDAGEELGYADEDVTTVVDVSGTVLRKRDSVRCYSTQMRPDFFFLAAPDDVVMSALNREYFVLIRSEVKTELPEHDLFAGIPPTSRT